MPPGRTAGRGPLRLREEWHGEVSPPGPAGRISDARSALGQHRTYGMADGATLVRPARGGGESRRRPMAPARHGACWHYASARSAQWLLAQRGLLLALTRPLALAVINCRSMAM